MAVTPPDDAAAPNDTGGFQPAIPPIVRTVVYFVALATGVASILATGLVAVWAPDYATQTAATAGTVSSAMAFLTGALGVAYRPTRHLTPEA